MEYYVFDNQECLKEKNSVIIGGGLYKHLAIVLRKKTGEKIELTDGKGNIYECNIVKIDKHSVYCEIINIKSGLYEPDIKVRLFISPLRNQIRFEFAVEKAVEIGVAEIIPVITKHTVNKNKFSDIKLKRLRNIIKSAAGQSQRCILPSLINTVSFSEMIELTNESKYKIVMYEHSDVEQNKHLKIENNKVDLLIGPEGGFCSDEIEILMQNGWIVMSLGKRKLRAETASVVSLFQILNY
jgi:16S rRNA (uracil1498-N3)-methyltransferase